MTNSARVGVSIASTCSISSAIASSSEIMLSIPILSALSTPSASDPYELFDSSTTGERDFGIKGRSTPCDSTPHESTEPRTSVKSAGEIVGSENDFLCRSCCRREA
jgi:hypothetical protein